MVAAPYDWIEQFRTEHGGAYRVIARDEIRFSQHLEQDLPEFVTRRPGDFIEL